MFEIRLLVVDSSKGLQTYVRQLFETFGFDPSLIQTTGDPETALEISKKLKPDFVLTDWYPGGKLTGIDLFQAIVIHSPECRLGLLSVDVGPEKLEQAKQAGALFLQVKPCAAVELRTVLGQALKQLSSEQPKLNSHVAEMTAAAARHLNMLKLAAASKPLTPGDRVQYKGRTESVLNVVARQGEIVVQLKGVAGFIRSSDVIKV
jgi:DNA-binding NtrC family response regulator